MVLSADDGWLRGKVIRFCAGCGGSMPAGCGCVLCGCLISVLLSVFAGVSMSVMLSLWTLRCVTRPANLPASRSVPSLVRENVCWHSGRPGPAA